MPLLVSDPLDVLLVDPDPDSAARLLRLLGEQAERRIHVSHIETAEEVRRPGAGVAYDAVLLRITTPPELGLTKLAKVFATVDRIPVFVLCSAADETLGIRAVRQGAVDYLLDEELTGTLLARTLGHGIERSKTELRVEAREQQLRLALEAGGMGTWEWRIHTGEVAWSPFVERMHGLAEHTFAGTVEAFESRLHPEDRARVVETLEQLVRQRASAYSSEYRIVRPDGEVRWVESRAKLITDRGGEPVRLLGVCMDITERKQAEVALRQSEEQLRQAQKMEAVGRLAGGIAHDFNNLLNVIGGNADLLEDAVAADSVARQDLDEIRRAVQRAVSLTRQLLAFSRKQLLAPEVIELGAWLERSGSMLQRLIGEDIQVELSPSREPCSVRVDPGQLDQVLMNLAVNARDAMPRGGALRIAIRPLTVAATSGPPYSTVPPGEYALLRVQDTGHGMDEETRERIFEPFFTTKEQGKGTGLGLSTVYGIVEQSGGHITVESRPGKGSCFHVLLPRLNSGAPREADEPAPDERQLGSETVLVVEDEAAVRRVISRSLREHGYTVLEAESGEEALEMFRRNHEQVALLVTDAVMPRMSGFELADRLRMVRPHLPILCLTGYSEEALRTRGLTEDGVSLLQKPVASAALTRTVRELLDSGHPPGP